MTASYLEEPTSTAAVEPLIYPDSSSVTVRALNQADNMHVAATEITNGWLGDQSAFESLKLNVLVRKGGQRDTPLALASVVWGMGTLAALPGVNRRNYYVTIKLERDGEPVWEKSGAGDMREFLGWLPVHFLFGKPKDAAYREMLENELPQVRTAMNQWLNYQHQQYLALQKNPDIANYRAYLSKEGNLLYRPRVIDELLAKAPTNNTLDWHYDNMAVMLNYKAYVARLPASVQRTIRSRPLPSRVLAVKGTRAPFMSPYTTDGVVAEWVDQAINKQIGQSAGSALGAAAGQYAAQKALEGIPGGGILGGTLGSMLGEAVGGKAAVDRNLLYETSDMSFRSVRDMVVYMEREHGDSANFPEVVEAVAQFYSGFEETMQARLNGEHLSRRGINRPTRVIGTPVR